MTETRMQLEDWLDDLCVRFIINLPEEDLSSVARICFQVEEAQWFYEDFIRPLDPTLPSMSLRSFCLRIFQHCPLLSEFSNDNHMRAFDEFLAYKTRVPVRGAIMLNHAMDSVVLVKGWKKGANWSFPRGKINKDEDDLDCAVREVYEETGYDIKAAGLVPQEQEIKYIEITMREQHMRLYVFRDVPMDTHFEPRTRKEISKIEWYRLSELPAFRKKGQQPVQGDAQAAINANKFYMVAPFLVPLKKWVTQQKKKDAQRATSDHFLAPPYMEDAITEEEAGTGTDKNAYATLSESENKVVLAPGLDTLEGATATLHRLLKIQPPTQGLQPPTSAIQSPTKDNGESLLALLQGKAKGQGPRNTSSLQLTHTPLEHIVTSTLSPMKSHNHHPRKLPDQPFFSIPAPPQFSFEQNLGPHLYQSQQQSQKFIEQPVGYQDTHQNYIPHFPLPQQPQIFAHRPDENQQLQHPQPLPPQVQRAVFNGFQPQPPLISQHVGQRTDTRFPQEITSTIQSPSFPNMRLPNHSQSMNQDPPLLTNHSLALLNAFKTRHQTASRAEGASDPRLQRFTEAVEAPSILPEDLPGQNNPAEMSGDDMAPSSTQAPHTTSVLTDEHRSSLLDIFKRPSSKPPINASPTKVQPIMNIDKSEQQFSASNSLAPFRTPNTQNIQPKSINSYSRNNETTFRPVSILTRPQQNSTSGPPSAGLETAKVRLNSKALPSLSPKRSQIGPQQEHESPATFQPQILRQSQPQQPQPIASFPTELTAPSPLVFTSFPLHSSLGRQPAVPAEHKQTLLSLFGKASAMANPPVSDASITREAGGSLESTSASGRSIVGNSASTAGDTSVASRRGSQTPTSPANTAFLLGYLQGITKNSGR